MLEHKIRGLVSIVSKPVLRVINPRLGVCKAALRIAPPQLKVTYGGIGEQPVEKEDQDCSGSGYSPI